MTKEASWLFTFDPAVDVWPCQQKNPKNTAVHQGQHQKKHEQSQFITLIPKDLERGGKVLGECSFDGFGHLS